MLPRGDHLQEILNQAAEQARNDAKSVGASIYYIRNNMRIREDADGHLFEIRFDESGNRFERALNENQ